MLLSESRRAASEQLRGSIRCSGVWIEQAMISESPLQRLIVSVYWPAWRSSLPSSLHLLCLQEGLAHGGKAMLSHLCSVVLPVHICSGVGLAERSTQQLLSLVCLFPRRSDLWLLFCYKQAASSQHMRRTCDRQETALLAQHAQAPH